MYINYSNGVVMKLEGWYALDGRSAPIWWDGKTHWYGRA